LTSENNETLSDLIALNDLVTSDEDAAYIESRIAALELADRETARQKATLEILTQQAAAWLVSISTKHLRDQGAARNADSTYNGRDLVEWIINRKVDDARQDWERKSDKIDSAKERQEAARADKLEIEAATAKGIHIRRDEVERDLTIALSRMNNRLNSTGSRVANLLPSEFKATAKQAVEDLIRLIQDEIARDFKV